MIKELFKFILPLAAIGLIILSRLKSSEISQNIISFLDTYNINFTWILFLFFLIAVYILWNDREKIRKYDDLNFLDTFDATLKIIFPILIGIELIIFIIR